MESPKLKAEIRDDWGRRNSKKLRNQGFIPGVIYGHSKETKPVKVNRLELQKLFNRYGNARTINLELEGQTVPVIIREVQNHIIKENLLHIDFQQLSENEKIRVCIPVILSGREKVEASTTVVQQQIMELELQCLPKYIPQSVVVNVSGLELGHSIKINDLDIANNENIEILDDITKIVVSLIASSKSEEPVEQDSIPIYESDKNSECLLGLKNGEIIKAPQNAKEMKKRESYYYQNREKKISKLNRAFHQYNYYSYEDTFAFCYLDEQPDYNNEFSKIIFGEGSKTLEKNFNKFKQEFETQLKNINKEIESLKRQQDAINEIAISMDMSFNLEPINVLMDKIGIKYEGISSNSEYEKLKKWLNNQNVILKSLKIEISNIIKRIDANSKNEIQEIYESKLEEEKNLGDKLDSLNKIIKMNQSNMQMLIKSSTSLGDSKKQLDDINKNFIEEKKVFDSGFSCIY